MKTEFAVVALTVIKSEDIYVNIYKSYLRKKEALSFGSRRAAVSLKLSVGGIK